jgi:sulfur carrier protein
MSIRIRLNGKAREVSGDHTVRSLLRELDLEPAMIVVELNRDILDRERYGDVVVREGDTLELVHFVGGG